MNKYKIWLKNFNCWMDKNYFNKLDFDTQRVQDTFINSEGKLVLFYAGHSIAIQDPEEYVIVRYTGLNDQSGKGDNELYEGDLITDEGKIRGNIYENEQAATDFLVPQIGTKTWLTKYVELVKRGFDYYECKIEEYR